ncbi:hypothetical protein V6N12_014226 [Hibiscus sabdariffa]|uniref:Cyclin N-terminal domain-containing protein n=1 Tax=Hibiscus sabdariffa TaxID=183260 RepID=A0ABR2DL55_9ROSI
MKILEALNYYLVVFHPYRTLAQGLVNDTTYKMDLILVHPPYLIALACVYIASVKNISMEILDFYENNKPISEERVTAALDNYWALADTIALHDRMLLSCLVL